MSSAPVIETFVENVRTNGLAGPVFLRKFLEYGCQFAARKVGETLPDSCDTREMSEFIVKACDKIGDTPLGAMVYALNTMIYGMSKAEALISGFTGPIFRLIIEASVKAQMDLLGFSDLTGRLEPLEAAKKFVEAITVSVPYFAKDSFHLSQSGHSEISLGISSCPTIEACKTLKDEGVRHILAEECHTASSVESWVKRLSGKAVDCRDLKRELSGSACKVMATIVVM